MSCGLEPECRIRCVVFRAPTILQAWKLLDTNRMHLEAHSIYYLLSKCTYQPNVIVTALLEEPIPMVDRNAYEVDTHIHSNSNGNSSGNSKSKE